jgi:hypothetical protein
MQKRKPSPAAGRRGRERSLFYYHSGQESAQNYTIKSSFGNQPPGWKKDSKAKESDHQGKGRKGGPIGTGDSNRFFYKPSAGPTGGCQCRPYFWCDYCHQNCHVRTTSRPSPPTVAQSAGTTGRVPTAEHRGSALVPRCVRPICLYQEPVLQLLETEELYGPVVEPVGGPYSKEQLVEYGGPMLHLLLLMMDRAKRTAPGAVLPQAVYSVEYTNVAEVQAIDLCPVFEREKNYVPVNMEVIPVQGAFEVVYGPNPPELDVYAWEAPAKVLRRHVRRSFTAVDCASRYLINQLQALYAWYAFVPVREMPDRNDRGACAHCKLNRRWTRFGLLAAALTFCWGCCEFYVNGESFPLKARTVQPALLTTYALGIGYYAWSNLVGRRLCLIHAAEDEARDLGTRIEFVLQNYQSLFMSARTSNEIKSLKLRFQSWLRTNHPDLSVEEVTWHMSQSMLGALRLSQCQNSWGLEISPVLPDLWSAHQMSRSGRLDDGTYLPTDQ